MRENCSCCGDAVQGGKIVIRNVIFLLADGNVHVERFTDEARKKLGELVMRTDTRAGAKPVMLFKLDSVKTSAMGMFVYVEKTDVVDLGGAVSF